MVLEPDAAVFADLVAKLPEGESYDGGDTGYLNWYFPDWSAGPLSEYLWKRPKTESRTQENTVPQPVATATVLSSTLQTGAKRCSLLSVRESTCHLSGPLL